MHKIPRNIRIFEALNAISIVFGAVRFYWAIASSGVSFTVEDLAFPHLFLIAPIVLVYLAGERRETWAAGLLAALTVFDVVAEFAVFMSWYEFRPRTGWETSWSRVCAGLNAVALGFYFFDNRHVVTAQPEETR